MIIVIITVIKTVIIIVTNIYLLCTRRLRI